MNLYQIQKNISQRAKIDSREVSVQIYNDQSIVFDFLFNNYFISTNYTVLNQTSDFIGRNKSKVSKIFSFPKFLRYISETYGSCPRSVNQADTVLSFKFAETNWAKIEAKFSEILEITFIYFGNKLCYILSVKRNNDINLAEHSDRPKVKYIGIQGNSNGFFLSCTRNHDLNDYVYELNSKDFLAVKYKMGVSMFRRVSKHSYKDLLACLPDSFHKLGDVIYAVETPKVLNTDKKNLLVSFFYTNKSNGNTVDRYCSHPFPFISDSTMLNTYITRMADASDAFGGHGLNTKFNENIEANIQDFIKSLMNTYSVDRGNIVICGAPSDGTGVVYYGLIGRYKVFAVDPPLGNRKYYGDKDPLYLHSIRTSIGEIFRKLPDETDHDLKNQVITSSAKVSEFYPDVKELKKVLPTTTLYEFSFEKIQKHLDFSGNTVSLSNTIINNLLLDIHITDSDISLG